MLVNWGGLLGMEQNSTPALNPIFEWLFSCIELKITIISLPPTPICSLVATESNFSYFYPMTWLQIKLIGMHQMHYFGSQLNPRILCEIQPSTELNFNLQMQIRVGKGKREPHMHRVVKKCITSPKSESCWKRLIPGLKLNRILDLVHLYKLSKANKCYIILIMQAILKIT